MKRQYDIKKQLGKRIRYLRRQKEYTQEFFAEKIKIEPQSLSNIERGKFAPSVETLQNIADMLGVYPFELYLFDDTKSASFVKKELIHAIEQSDIIAFELYRVYQGMSIKS